MAVGQNDLSRFKASRHILGMAVYSIQEGQNLGLVKGLVIDAKEKCLLALVIEKKRMTKEEKLLPYTAVNSIGDDVITVDRLNMLERRGSNQEIMRALRRPVQPLGARCFTAAGRTLGKVEECYFDPESGRIARLEVSDGNLFKGRALVPGELIIALAPHTIMLREEATTESVPLENNLLSSMETARDKAATLSRNTVTVLNNSFNKLKSNSHKEEAVITVDADIDANSTDNIATESNIDSDIMPFTPSAAEEQVAQENDTLDATIIEPETLAEIPTPLPQMSEIEVEVLTPEEASLLDGRPVDWELRDLITVQADDELELPEDASTLPSPPPLKPLTTVKTTPKSKPQEDSAPVAAGEKKTTARKKKSSNAANKDKEEIAAPSPEQDTSPAQTEAEASAPAKPKRKRKTSAKQTTTDDITTTDVDIPSTESNKDNNSVDQAPADEGITESSQPDKAKLFFGKTYP